MKNIVGIVMYNYKHRQIYIYIKKNKVHINKLI